MKKLLFVDTNIWLDFYRARNEAGRGLLNHLEEISDDIIVTYQLESEFKTNRQFVILQGMKDLEAPKQIQRLPIFSDARESEVIGKNWKKINNDLQKLKGRLGRALRDPGRYDPVYQACQRIFHRKSEIVLTRTNKMRHLIRRMAFRRFLHGCPPRKKTDTSIGDAFNWEWMVHCANKNSAELVIVSRDSDYGTSFENESYINDHLRQEFSERVSKKRNLLLFSKLSEALKLFKVEISKQEEEAETELVEGSNEEINKGLYESVSQWLESMNNTRNEIATVSSLPDQADNLGRLKQAIKSAFVESLTGAKPNLAPKKPDRS